MDIVFPLLLLNNMDPQYFYCDAPLAVNNNTITVTLSRCKIALILSLNITLFKHLE